MSIDFWKEPPDGALTGALRYWRPALQSLRIPPPALGLTLAQCYLRLAAVLMPRRRRRTIRSLALAGYDSPRIRAAALRSLARYYATFARLPFLTKEQIPACFFVEGEEYYRAARAQGRGVLIATGHLGHWDLAAYARGLAGDPIHLVTRIYPDASFEGLARHYRTRSGNQLIAGAGSARKILAALRRNQGVAMMIDANVPPPGDMEVAFLGATVRASTALVRLAASSGAVVLPCFTMWCDRQRRYIARTQEPFTVSGDACHDTRRLYRLLETEVRRYPDQWFWAFDPCWARPNGD